MFTCKFSLEWLLVVKVHCLGFADQGAKVGQVGYFRELAKMEDNEHDIKPRIFALTRPEWEQVS